MTCPKASDGDVPICIMEFLIHEDDFQARPQNRSLIHATRLDQVKLKFENFIFSIPVKALLFFDVFRLVLITQIVQQLRIIKEML